MYEEDDAGTSLSDACNDWQRREGRNSDVVVQFGIEALARSGEKLGPPAS
jgi:hypothetical protein